MRLGPAIATIGLALACADHGHAAGVFLPVGTSVPASQTAPASAREAHQGRFVRIAHNELQRARAEVGNFGRSHLLLNMSERLQLDVAVERTTRTLDGYTLSGNIDGGKGGFVTLAVHQQMVAGSIWTWGTNYEVAPVGGGVHAVRQVMDEPVECVGVVQAQPVDPTEPVPTTSTIDEAVVVDVLAFWTPAMEATRVDESHAKLTIELAIAYANDALERSGALVSLNLVGTELLDVEDVSPLDTLAVLEGEHVTERANALGADFVSAFTATGSGRAIVAGPLSVVGGSYNYVFSHEVGHNLGVLHDRGASMYPGFSYDAGHVGTYTDGTVTDCTLTIMSYADVCVQFGVHAIREIPYYSMPNRYHPANGTPLGVSRLSNRRGWDGPADAVFTINRSRHRASNIRPRLSGP